MSQIERIRTTSLALFALFVGTLFTAEGRALTIDCATAGCIGGIYTLNVSETAPDLYLATYTIDTSVPFSVAATTLVDINIKVANNYLNPTILSGPAGIVGAGPLTGGGCGGGNASFICADLSPNLALGGVYTWQIQFGASSLIAVDEWHVGARYTAPGKEKGWVISETAGTNPVPEPSAALVFGFGMLVAGGLVTRPRVRD